MKHPGYHRTQQQRRFMLIIPFLTIPFLTLTFWALGGGKNPEDLQIKKAIQGLNLELPGISDSNEGEMDKLEHYQRSSSDSIQIQKELKKDPYYQMAFRGEEISESKTENEKGLPDYLYSDPNAIPFRRSSVPLIEDPQEEKILKRLEALNRTLNENQDFTTKSLNSDKTSQSPSDKTQSSLNQNLDRLGQMMQQLKTDPEPDPEFQQMAELLDKILDIQHPQRVQQRLEAKKVHHPIKKAQYLKPDNLNEFSVLQADKQEGHAGPLENKIEFFGLEDFPSQQPSSQSILAVIQEDQSLVSGETVKLRLIHQVVISGKTLPKDQLIYGVANLNRNRLHITIQQIRLNDQLIPVDVTIHDADGLEGILIPGSITQEVSSQTGAQGIQSLGLTTFDNSLEAQATAAGIESAKGMLRKKIRLSPVHLKAGYRVWLSQNESSF